MFKKLHSFQQDSQWNINQERKSDETTYRKTFAKNTILKKKSQSYGEKFRKKQNLVPQVPNLQIVESDTFVFQGRLASVLDGSSLIPTEREKHGQGVMFLKNGTLIVGFWDHGLLHGRALIFTPFGGKTIAEFYNGKLNGWAITLFAQRLVVCAVYYDNKIDGQKIIFEANEKMWVGSKYSSQTQSFKIVHVQKGKMSELPDFLKISQSPDLADLYNDFINNQSCCMALREIQYVQISQNLSYIGYCNEEGHPSGLGAIFGKYQFYLGHFREGSLECYGRMIFENGEIYQGELLNGVFYGQGVYYNPSKNLSTIMSTNRQEQKVIDQQEGYICINPPSNYFKYNKHGQTGMIGDSLKGIYEIIEKYYSSFFIEAKQPQSDHISVHSQFGVSENMDDIEQSMGDGYYSKEKKSRMQLKTSNEVDQQKKWLDFNRNESPSLDQKSYDNSGYEESQVQLQRAYSLDKRQVAHRKQHLAQQSIPANFQELKSHSKAHQESLELEMNKLRIDRNFSLKQRTSQNHFNFQDKTKIKQNINPYQKQGNDPFQAPHVTKRNTINFQQKEKLITSEQALTFRNKANASELKNDQSFRNERKYSHMVEPNINFSPKDSVISNLSHKVEGMINKTNPKRKKIFM